MRKVLVALVALSFVVGSQAFAGLSKIPMSTAGGDSLSVAADTSAAITVSKNATGTIRFVAAVSDSSATYIVQVSPDGTNWFNATTLDTVTAGAVEATADLSEQYPRPWQFRVIMDNLGTAIQPFGAAFLSTKK